MNTQSSEQYLAGVDAGISAINGLTNLYQKLSVATETILSPAAARLYQITYESHTDLLREDRLQVSLEDHQDGLPVSIALESIMDGLRRIWKAIVDTLKLIFKKIRDFFVGEEVKVKKSKKKIKKSEFDLDQVKRANGGEYPPVAPEAVIPNRDKPSPAPVSPTIGLITDTDCDNLVHAFSKQGKSEQFASDILVFTKQSIESCKKYDLLLKGLLEFSDSLNKVLDFHDRQGREMAIGVSIKPNAMLNTYEAMSREILGYKKQYIDDVISSQFDSITNSQHLADKLRHSDQRLTFQEIELSGSYVDQTFLYEDSIYYLKVLADGGEEFPVVLSVQGKANDKRTPLHYATGQNIRDLIVEREKLTNAISTLQVEYQHKTIGIRKMLDASERTIDVFLKDPELMKHPALHEAGVPNLNKILNSLMLIGNTTQYIFKVIKVLGSSNDVVAKYIDISIAYLDSQRIESD